MIINHNCCIKLVRLVIFIYDARSHIHQILNSFLATLHTAFVWILMYCTQALRTELSVYQQQRYHTAQVLSRSWTAQVTARRTVLPTFICERLDSNFDTYTELTEVFVANLSSSVNCRDSAKHVATASLHTLANSLYYYKKLFESMQSELTALLHKL